MFSTAHVQSVLCFVNGPAAGEGGEGANFQLTLPRRDQLEVGAGTSQNQVLALPSPLKDADWQQSVCGGGRQASGASPFGAEDQVKVFLLFSTQNEQLRLAQLRFAPLQKIILHTPQVVLYIVIAVYLLCIPLNLYKINKIKGRIDHKLSLKWIFHFLFSG